MTELRVLGVIHDAWPAQRAGSEVAVHRLLAWLAKSGHEVRCIVLRGAAAPLDGVDYASASSIDVGEWWDWADVAVTQLKAASSMASLREVHGDLPALQWAHNFSLYPKNRQYLDARIDGIAFNSTAMSDRFADDWNGASMVLRPPVFAEDYAPCYGSKVTQVNLSRLKGSATFWELARRFPHLDFVGVAGGWGAQSNAAGKDVPVDGAANGLRRGKPKNVEIIDGTADMVEDVFAQTRVLLMPTGWVNDEQVGESWGLVAAEAICCGIPVLATDSPGTRELFGDSGVLLPHDDIDAWSEALLRLEDPDEWAVESERAFERAGLLDPTVNLEEAVLLLEELASA